MPEIGWFSSTREEDAGRRGRCPKAVVSLTRPYACGHSRRPSASGGKRPARAPQGPHVDENLPIPGRSPLLFCHEGSRGRLRGRARINDPTAPRRRKRAVDQAIESSHHTQSERHIGSHRPASLSTRQTMVLQSHLSKLLCFRYASTMTKFEYIYKIAADNHGLITSAQAREAEITNNELVQYAKRGRIAKVGHGIYQLEQWVPDPSDTYAWTVMPVGPDTLLYGESVIALPDLTPTNPTRTFVAALRRTRRTSKA